VEISLKICLIEMSHRNYFLKQCSSCQKNLFFKYRELQSEWWITLQRFYKWFISCFSFFIGLSSESWVCCFYQINWQIFCSPTKFNYSSIQFSILKIILFSYLIIFAMQSLNYRNIHKIPCSYHIIQTLIFNFTGEK
jgi:hypothetical protein